MLFHLTVMGLSRRDRFINSLQNVTKTKKDILDTETHITKLAGNNRVRVYSTSGEPLLVIGMKGHGNGQFNLPTSVAIHRNKFVLVAESGNQRVQVRNCSQTKTKEYNCSPNKH